MQQEKRHFQRVGIYLSGQLITGPGDTLPVEVVDVSLQGLRVTWLSSAAKAPPTGSVELSFKANEDSPPIILSGEIIRHSPSLQEENLTEAGIRITYLSVDDLALLRRLLLLNSGRDDLDATELESLVDKITAALSS